MAVCAFRMKDVIKAFEGAFKEQLQPHHNWLPATENVPVPHPAKVSRSTTHNLDYTNLFVSQ